MKLALAEAQKAAKAEETPIGAVVVVDGRVIAAAHNTREHSHDITAHAELLAVRAAAKEKGDWRLNDCEIYVTLEPCTMCAGAIANARIGRLYFGAYERKGGACGSLRNVLDNTGLNSNVQVVGGVLEEECSGLITGFFENKRNKITF